VRGRRELVVVAAGLLAVVLCALPAVAQVGEPSTTTTPPTEQTTSTTETGITLLPTTTSSTEQLETTTTTIRRRSTTTTTVRRSTTTTVATGPAITLPASTTTSELLEPNAPIELPTTTSLPPATKVDRGISAGSLVLLVIGALLLIALVLAVFTYRFWRSTRPAPPSVGSTVPGHG
jgi:cobalamin biosynthesis Mg chelatase CobN